VSRPAAIALFLAATGCVPAKRQPSQDDAGNTASRSGSRPRAELLAVSANAAPSTAPAPSAELPELDVLLAPFKDDFERAELGDDYFATAAQYRIDRGKLCVKGARNHPLWLRHRLPKNARIEVDAQTTGNDGDIKLEAWGDGHSAASKASYTNATSYIAIFGGWKNSYHVLARLDEHAANRPEVAIEPGSDDPRQQSVLADRRYRLKLERADGHSVRFWVDDVELLSFADPEPLSGVGHEHFAFNAWETPVCFDNLVVAPLPG
jgi:hypothetical protein